MGQAVINGLAADVTRGLVLFDAGSVLVSCCTVALDHAAMPILVTGSSSASRVVLVVGRVVCVTLLLGWLLWLVLSMLWVHG